MEKIGFIGFLRDYVEAAVTYNQRILDGVKGLVPIIQDHKTPADIMVDFEEYAYTKFDQEGDSVLIEEVLEIANDCLTGAMEAADDEDNGDFTTPISWN